MAGSSAVFTGAEDVGEEQIGGAEQRGQVAGVALEEFDARR